MAAVIAPAADTPEATVAYRPGDTVRVIVTFKEPISLKNAMLRFNLQGALPAGQKVFTSLFDGKWRLEQDQFGSGRHFVPRSAFERTPCLLFLHAAPLFEEERDVGALALIATVNEILSRMRWPVRHRRR
jgi:hypothetical protein